MKVVLKGVRLAFPDLWVAKEYEAGDGKFRYNATYLVEPGSDNDKAIQAAIGEVAKETYGAKASAMLESLRGNANKYCYLKGDLKEYDGFAGMLYLSTHRNQGQGAPKVVDKDPKVDLLASSGKPYAGCYVNATVDIYAQKGQYPGIRASMIAVQFAKDGDAFAGTPASADDFEDLSDGADSDEFASMV